MEDTLRAVVANGGKQQDACLNPCFNGRYSQRCSKSKVQKVIEES